MVYGRILYNNIKQYTPKWYPTIPYSQTIKPTYRPRIQGSQSYNTSANGKTFWRNFAFVFQRHSFMWQVVIVGLAFIGFEICYRPILYIYQANNTHRSFKAAMTKQRAYKKKLKDAEAAEQAESKSASQ